MAEPPTYPEACEMAKDGAMDGASRVCRLSPDDQLHALWSLVLAELEAHPHHEGYMSEEQFHISDWCGTCNNDNGEAAAWPCPTVRRMLAVLEGLR